MERDDFMSTFQSFELLFSLQSERSWIIHLLQIVLAFCKDSANCQLWCHPAALDRVRRFQQPRQRLGGAAELEMSVPVNTDPPQTQLPVLWGRTPGFSDLSKLFKHCQSPALFSARVTQ